MLKQPTADLFKADPPKISAQFLWKAFFYNEHFPFVFSRLIPDGNEGSCVLKQTRNTCER